MGGRKQAPTWANFWLRAWDLTGGAPAPRRLHSVKEAGPWTPVLPFLPQFLLRRVPPGSPAGPSKAVGTRPHPGAAHSSAPPFPGCPAPPSHGPAAQPALPRACSTHLFLHPQLTRLCWAPASPGPGGPGPLCSCAFSSSAYQGPAHEMSRFPAHKALPLTRESSVSSISRWLLGACDQMQHSQLFLKSRVLIFLLG